MGDYLMLSWLKTRRGFTIFILFVLIAVVSSLFRLASSKENTKPTPAKNSLSQPRAGELTNK